jgi:hypothetical protein
MMRSNFPIARSSKAHVEKQRGLQHEGRVNVPIVAAVSQRTGGVGSLQSSQA